MAKHRGYEITYTVVESDEDYDRKIMINVTWFPFLIAEERVKELVRFWIAEMRDANVIRETDAISIRHTEIRL